MIIITIILDATFPSIAYGQCEPHLPTSPQSRIIGGLPADPLALDNIVTIAYDTEQNSRDYRCAGSLIAPDWVLTAAQCFVLPGRDYVLYGGGHSLAGTPRRITRFITHPSWNSPSTSGNDNDNGDDTDAIIPPTRGDLGLLQLDEPITSPSSRDGDLNLMRVNTNDKFAIPPANDRFLRFKGFGVTTPPTGNDEPLQGIPRQLKFADLRTTPCADVYMDDSRRRLCTSASDKCTPCYGDVGGPLYDVDASASVNVLVGVLSIDALASTNTSACALADPVVYTAIAPYVPWILSVLPNNTLTLQALPADGISDVDLAPKPAPFPALARTSIIIVSALVLLAVLIALIVTTVLGRVRERRRRWKEGLLSEDSFVDPGAVYVYVDDPFEGIATQAQKKRPILTTMLIAVTKMSKCFSSQFRSNEASPSRPSPLGERQPNEDAPSWLNSAWERLFRPLSNSNSNASMKNEARFGARSSVHFEPAVDLRVEREDAELEATWRDFDVRQQRANVAEGIDHQNLELLCPDLFRANSSKDDFKNAIRFPRPTLEDKRPVAQNNTFIKSVPFSVSKSAAGHLTDELQKDSHDVALAHPEEFMFEGALTSAMRGGDTVTDSGINISTAEGQRFDATTSERPGLILVNQTLKDHGFVPPGTKVSSLLSRCQFIDRPEDYTLSSDSETGHEISVNEFIEMETIHSPNQNVPMISSTRIDTAGAVETKLREKTDKYSAKDLSGATTQSAGNSRRAFPLYKSKESTSVSECLKVRFPAFELEDGLRMKRGRNSERAESRSINQDGARFKQNKDSVFAQRDSSAPVSLVSFEKVSTTFRSPDSSNGSLSESPQSKVGTREPSTKLLDKDKSGKTAAVCGEIPEEGVGIFPTEEFDKKEIACAVSFEKEDVNHRLDQSKPSIPSKRLERVQRRIFDADALDRSVVLQ